MAKWFYSITAVFGGVVGYLTGEWSAPMYALLVLMGIDFVTGIIKGAMSKSVTSVPRPLGHPLRASSGP